MGASFSSGFEASPDAHSIWCPLRDMSGHGEKDVATRAGARLLEKPPALTFARCLTGREVMQDYFYVLIRL